MPSSRLTDKSKGNSTFLLWEGLDLPFVTFTYHFWIGVHNMSMLMQIETIEGDE